MQVVSRSLTTFWQATPSSDPTTPLPGRPWLPTLMRFQLSSGHEPPSRTPRRALRAFVVAGWTAGLGLRLGPRPSADHVLGWKIELDAPDLIILEATFRFGTAHNVLQVEKSRVLIASFVRNEKRGGRTVWSLVAPLHEQILPYVLGHAASEWHLRDLGERCQLTDEWSVERHLEGKPGSVVSIYERFCRFSRGLWALHGKSDENGDRLSWHSPRLRRCEAETILPRRVPRSAERSAGREIPTGVALHETALCAPLSHHERRADRRLLRRLGERVIPSWTRSSPESRSTLIEPGRAIVGIRKKAAREGPPRTSGASPMTVAPWTRQGCIRLRLALPIACTLAGLCADDGPWAVERHLSP